MMDIARVGGGELDRHQVVGKMTINVELDIREMNAAHLIDGDIGHAWVEFTPKDEVAKQLVVDEGREDLLDSAGFYPRDAFSLNPLEDVRGWVKSPDPHEGDASHQLSYDVSLDQLEKAYGYAQAKVDAEYNLYTYNCTDFAIGVIEAAGLPAPDGDILGVDFPNELAENLKQVAEIDSAEPMTLMQAIEDNYTDSDGNYTKD